MTYIIGIGRSYIVWQLPIEWERLIRISDILSLGGEGVLDNNNTMGYSVDISDLIDRFIYQLILLYGPILDSQILNP